MKDTQVSANESTSSEVSDRMESIMEEIRIYRHRLQEAKEKEDKYAVQQITTGAIKSMTRYYHEIESIPENMWENLGLGVVRSVIQLAGLALSIVSCIDTISSTDSMLRKGAAIGSATASGLSSLKQIVDEIDYKKINDKNLGNKNRKFFSNITKEKALKTINDTIIMMQRAKKEFS